MTIYLTIRENGMGQVGPQCIMGHAATTLWRALTWPETVVKIVVVDECTDGYLFHVEPSRSPVISRSAYQRT